MRLGNGESTRDAIHMTTSRCAPLMSNLQKNFNSVRTLHERPRRSRHDLGPRIKVGGNQLRYVCWKESNQRSASRDHYRVSIKRVVVIASKRQVLAGFERERNAGLLSSS